METEFLYIQSILSFSFSFFVYRLLFLGLLIHMSEPNLKIQNLLNWIQKSPKWMERYELLDRSSSSGEYNEVFLELLCLLLMIWPNATSDKIHLFRSHIRKGIERFELGRTLSIPILRMEKQREGQAEWTQAFGIWHSITGISQLDLIQQSIDSLKQMVEDEMFEPHSPYAASTYDQDYNVVMEYLQDTKRTMADSTNLVLKALGFPIEDRDVFSEAMISPENPTPDLNSFTPYQDANAWIHQELQKVNASNTIVAAKALGPLFTMAPGYEADTDNPTSISTSVQLGSTIRKVISWIFSTRPRVKELPKTKDIRSSPKTSPSIEEKTTVLTNPFVSTSELDSVLSQEDYEDEIKKQVDLPLEENEFYPIIAFLNEHVFQRLPLFGNIYQQTNVGTSLRVALEQSIYPEKRVSEQTSVLRSLLILITDVYESRFRLERGKSYRLSASPFKETIIPADYKGLHSAPIFIDLIKRVQLQPPRTMSPKEYDKLIQTVLDEFKKSVLIEETKEGTNLIQPILKWNHLLVAARENSHTKLTNEAIDSLIENWTWAQNTTKMANLTALLTPDEQDPTKNIFQIPLTSSSVDEKNEIKALPSPPWAVGTEPEEGAITNLNPETRQLGNIFFQTADRTCANLKETAEDVLHQQDLGILPKNNSSQEVPSVSSTSPNIIMATAIGSILTSPNSWRMGTVASLLVIRDLFTLSAGAVSKKMWMNKPVLWMKQQAAKYKTSYLTQVTPETATLGVSALLQSAWLGYSLYTNTDTLWQLLWDSPILTNVMQTLGVAGVVSLSELIKIKLLPSNSSSKSVQISRASLTLITFLTTNYITSDGLAQVPTEFITLRDHFQLTLTSLIQFGLNKRFAPTTEQSQQISTFVNAIQTCTTQLENNPDLLDDLEETILDREESISGKNVDVLKKSIKSNSWFGSGMVPKWLTKTEIPITSSSSETRSFISNEQRTFIQSLVRSFIEETDVSI